MNKLRSCKYFLLGFLFNSSFLISECANDRRDETSPVNCPLIPRYNDSTGIGIFAGQNFEEGDLLENSLGIPTYWPDIKHTELGM